MAHTHAPNFAGSALESVDSSLKSADSTTSFMIVGRLPILNIFDINRDGVRAARCAILHIKCKNRALFSHEMYDFPIY